MYNLKGIHYLIGFIFQTFFWKLVLLYVIYYFHKDCNLYAQILKSNNNSKTAINDLKTK